MFSSCVTKQPKLKFNTALIVYPNLINFLKIQLKLFALVKKNNKISTDHEKYQHIWTLHLHSFYAASKKKKTAIWNTSPQILILRFLHIVKAMKLHNCCFLWQTPGNKIICCVSQLHFVIFFVDRSWECVSPWRSSATSVDLDWATSYRQYSLKQLIF